MKNIIKQEDTISGLDEGGLTESHEDISSLLGKLNNVNRQI